MKKKFFEKKSEFKCDRILNRVKFPLSFKKENLKRGEFYYRTKENLMALRYSDKKEVYFLSTLTRIKCNSKMVILFIADYNAHMGGVDKNAML